MNHLPPALAAWSETLADLDPALATELGPMIRVIDDLVARLDSGSGPDGPFDGYDGTTTRGEPDRLLASEWLLASEIPLEFLRRAAENELLHLRPARRSTHQRGRVLALVDSGPEQLGGGRLVQLAALVVLARRASQVGSELQVVDLQSGATLSGPLAAVLPQWLRLRSVDPVTTSSVSPAFETAGHDDRVWVLGGATALRLLNGHQRVVGSSVSGWGPHGVTSVRITVGDAVSELALPTSDAAVASLRGEGLTRSRGVPGSSGRDPRESERGQGVRGAVFTSSEPVLLWRGATTDVLCVLRVRGSGPARIREHRFEGDVLAAAMLGRRLVVVVSDGRRVSVKVVGKHLARVDRIQHPIGSLDLDAGTIREHLSGPLQPLYFVGRGLLVPVGGTWWDLREAGAWRSDVVAAAPGRVLDAPRILEADQGVIRPSDEWAPGLESTPATMLGGPLLGPHRLVAWSVRSRVWHVRDSDGDRHEDIGVEETDQVVGVTRLGNDPALVTVSGTGLIVRHVTSRSTRTWTAWAGPAEFGLHPTEPWLVRADDEGVLVGDLRTGSSVLEWRRTT